MQSWNKAIEFKVKIFPINKFHVERLTLCPFVSSPFRPDVRLRSLVYKLIPGLYAKEQQRKEADGHQKIFLNGSAQPVIGKHERQPLSDTCTEDESLALQYFYDQDEPIRWAFKSLIRFINCVIRYLAGISGNKKYCVHPHIFKILIL